MQRNASSQAAWLVPLVATARRLVVLSLVWLILAGGGALPLGAVVVPAACWLSFRLLPPTGPLRLTLLVETALGFVWRSLLGGLDVARRAFDPRLPLDPGWIDVEVDLPEGGKVALGGKLSLMPGTLVAGSDGRRLLVHVLDRGQDVARTVRVEEARLGRVIDRAGRGRA